MHYYIYEITNNINGKTYIGQHKSKSLSDNYYGSGTIIKQAIKKYGLENFSKIILEECSEETINDRETYWISKQKEIGKAEYNIAEGGFGCGNPFKYKSKEELKLIYNKMSKTRKGKPSGIAGKRKSKNKNYLVKGIHNVKKQPCKNSRALKCNETNQVFNSIRECCDVLKIRHDALKDYLNGDRNYPIGGYTFTELEHIVVPYIIIMETEQIFETVIDCAEYLQCSKSSIIRNITGKTKSCVGYHICYFKDYSRKENIYFGKERYSVPKRTEYKSYNIKFDKKKIKCNETNKEYNSVKECAEDMGLKQPSISMVLTGRRKSLKGYTFSFL